MSWLFKTVDDIKSDIQARATHLAAVQSWKLELAVKLEAFRQRIEAAKAEAVKAEALRQQLLTLLK